MQREYRLVGINCAHCGEKIRAAASQLSGVKAAQFSLPAQRLSLDVADSISGDFDESVQQTVWRFEPGIASVCLSGADAEAEERAAIARAEAEEKRELIEGAAGALLLGIGVALGSAGFSTLGMCVLVLSYAVLGARVLVAAARNLLARNPFDEQFLMSVATVGALAIGEAPEACAVMLFYRVGEWLTARAVAHSRRSISALAKLKPDVVHLVTKKGRNDMPAQGAVPGDIIEVLPGERLPLDGQILSGASTLDTSALTGESMPRDVVPGEEVLAGCVNGAGLLRIRVTRGLSQSAVSRILALTQQETANKAPAEKFIARFARVYTPIVVGLAVALAVLPPLFGAGAWSEWLYRGLLFLLVSCPCALVLSVPLTFFAGVGAASRHGVLIKGGNHLETLAHIDRIAFDKTGTLTQGAFRIVGIAPAPGVDERRVLETAALCESKSTHPLAQAIVRAAPDAAKGAEFDRYEDIAGEGVRCAVRGRELLAGNARLLARYSVAHETLEGTRVYVAEDGALIGSIELTDPLRPSAAAAVAELRALGVGDSMMLTGDSERGARGVASAAGVSELHAGLLPEQKVEHMRAFREGHLAAYVGDGINDAPVLATADVGIAMGGLGSDAAVQAADVVLLGDDLSQLAGAVRISRKTSRIVRQNVALALGLKAFVLLLGALGLASMWMTVVADVGVSMLCVFNALRVMRAGRTKAA